MPDTTLGITYPASSANTNLWEHFQALAEDVDTLLQQRKARGLMAAPTTSVTDGTGSSGTTVTRDAVFGDYTFTSVASRRYRVFFTGILNGSVVNDRFIISIRDGGASTPTGSSTVVKEGIFATIIATGSSGRLTFSLEGTWTPSAGVHTLSLFVQRLSGTGVGTIVGARELYVEDIGEA